MGATADFAKPAIANPIDTDLDAIRDNYHYLLVSAATSVSFSEGLDKSGPVLPGWQTSVDTAANGNIALPDGYVLTNGTRAIYIHFTWTGSPAELATIQICYADGVSSPGIVCFDAVSLTQIDLLWDTDPITLFCITDTVSAQPKIVFMTESAVSSYFGLPSSLGSSVARYTHVFMQSGNEWYGVVPTFTGDYGAGEYVVRYEIASRVSGSCDVLINGVAGTELRWYDANNLTISLDDTTTSPTEVEHLILNVTVARDDGLGSAIFGTWITKQVTIIAQTAGYSYVVKDLFTDLSGTNLTAHSPVVGGTWVAHAGTFTVQSNRAVSGGEARYVIDAATANCALSAELKFDSQSAGIIGRAQDASNYWELLVEAAGTGDPVLKLNEVVAGIPNTRDSITMTGQGPSATRHGIDSLADRYLRLMFDGNDIFGVCHMGGSLTLWEVTYTSTSYNTATLFGIHSTSAATTWDNMQISSEEIGLIT